MLHFPNTKAEAEREEIMDAEDAAYEVGVHICSLAEDIMAATDRRMSEWFRYKDYVAELEAVHYQLYQVQAKLAEIGLMGAANGKP